jgi:hypothetical protein
MVEVVATAAGATLPSAPRTLKAVVRKARDALANSNVGRNMMMIPLDLRLEIGVDSNHTTATAQLMMMMEEYDV